VEEVSTDLQPSSCFHTSPYFSFARFEITVAYSNGTILSCRIQDGTHVTGAAAHWHEIIMMYGISTYMYCMIRWDSV
jgi:hypothetical protein